RFRKTVYDIRNLGIPEAWVLRRNETDENDWFIRRSDGLPGSPRRRIPCDRDRSQHRTGRRPRRIAAGPRHRELGRAQHDEHGGVGDLSPRDRPTVGQLFLRMAPDWVP